MNYKPTLPLFIYNGECGFCRYWVSISKNKTGDNVLYKPFQDVLSLFPEISQKSFEKAVKLRTPDGSTYSGAHATFKALAYNPRYKFLVHLYNYAPGFCWLSEIGYNIISTNRDRIYSLINKGSSKCEP